MPTRLCRSCDVRWPILLWIAVALCLPLTWRMAAMAAAPPATVDDLGDPARLRFVGCDRVPADHVRHAIRMDWRLQLASSPSGPRADYIALLAERLTIAYRANGFAEARVAVAPDAEGDAIVIRVTEGERRLTGPLKVEGAVEGIDVQAIIRLVAAPQGRGTSPLLPVDEGAAWMLPTVAPQLSGESLERNKPLWKEGEAIRSASEDGLIRERVVEALRRQGRHQPRFTLERREEKEHIAMIVNIADAGPSCEIEAWEVKGLSANSRRQLDELLGNPPPSAATLETLAAMREKLWNSARFLKHDLTLRPDPDRPGKATLVIDLVENPAAPPLGRPLSEKQRIVLRWGRWLDAQIGAGRELSLAHETAELKGSVILAPKRGVAVWMKIKPGVVGPQSLEGSLVATDRLLAARGPYGRSYKAPNNTGRGIVSYLAVLPNPDLGPDDPMPSRISFGAVLELDDLETGAPVSELIFAAVPAALLRILDPATSRSELTDGVLQIKAENHIIRLKAETGEMLELRFDQTSEQTEPTRIAFEEGALERKAKEMAASEDLNMYEAGRPVGSLVSFLAHGWCATGGLDGGAAPDGGEQASAPQRLAAADVLAKLLSAKTLEPLDIAWRRRELPEITFHIPSDNTAGYQDLFLAIAPFADFVFQRGSWPWTLTREISFLLGGQGGDFQREITRLYSNEAMGPVGHLIVAELFAKTGFAPVAGLFARQGLARLNAKSFREDCRYLLKDGSPWMTMLGQVMRNFQELKEAEVRTLGAVMTREHAAALLTFWRQMQPQAGRTADETLDAALETIWDSTLKQLIGERLRGLTGAA